MSCPLATSSWTACSVHAVTVAESRCIADLIGPPIVIKRCKNPRTDVRGVSGKAIHGLPRRTHHLSSAMSAGLVICEYRSSGTGPNPTAAQQASLYASVERTSSKTASWFRNGRKLPSGTPFPVRSPLRNRCSHASCPGVNFEPCGARLRVCAAHFCASSAVSGHSAARARASETVLGFGGVWSGSGPESPRTQLGPEC